MADPTIDCTFTFKCAIGSAHKLTITKATDKAAYEMHEPAISIACQECAGTVHVTPHRMREMMTLGGTVKMASISANPAPVTDQSVTGEPVNG